MTADELRALILGHAGVVEKQHHGKPDFRVNGKIAVNMDEAGRTITVKLDLARQSLLVSTFPPEMISLPGGWAKYGWTTVSFEHAPDALIRELVAEAVGAS